MTEVLVEFNRVTGHVHTEVFDGENARQRALAARIASERVHADRPEVEIVVLSAESEDDIKHTHARYFQSVSELATRFRTA